MVKPRLIETGEGIQGDFDVRIYDQMMRRMRDKGWLEIREILKTGTSLLVEEIEAVLRECLPAGFRVEKKAMGLLITGTKAG